MKTALTVSSLFNLALVGSLVFLLNRQNTERGLTAPPATVSVHESTAVVTTPALVVETVKAKPFNWHQLEASDYRSYVRNLRTCGCPESTVRAIVTADVSAVYRLKTHELEQKLAALANGSWSVQLTSYAEQQTLKAAIQKIPAEENAKVADLLGLAPPTISNVAEANSSPASTIAVPVAASSLATTQTAVELAATPLPTSNGQNSLAGNSIAYPLVFQKVDLTSLNLSPDQIQAVQNLKQSFVNQIGGQNQDPNDPAYRQRWLEAQDTSDNMLRDLLGWAGFSSYQIAVRANPNAAAPVTP